MKVVIAGRGSGSWQVRGVQLGAAIGAAVNPNPASVAGFDVAVMVKRRPEGFVERVHAAGLPLIWDIVDAYPQPGANEWDRTACLRWLRQQVEAARPAAIVAATAAMAADCEEFRVPVLTLPHHARSGQVVNPVRDAVKLVGYEGSEAHLGRWRSVLDALCARRGWRFVVNPPALAELDIVVALRDAGGYAPRHWKSNVKLANAQATGTAIVCAREAGYLETACRGEQWADTEEELEEALDALEPWNARRRASDLLQAASPRLESIASTYAAWIEQVTCAKAARS